MVSFLTGFSIAILLIASGCSSSHVIIPEIAQTTTVDRQSEQAQKISQAIDSRNPITRNYAVQQAAKDPGQYNLIQTAYIWFSVYNSWRYVSDPRGSDYYASASESIQDGFVGDCDDFAITIAALIESIGGQSRVIVAQNGTVGHAFAEVYVGKATDPTTIAMLGSLSVVIGKTPGFEVENNGDLWLNLDWSAGYPGGPLFQSTSRMIVYPDGTFQTSA